jgi:hypothetical protein
MKRYCVLGSFVALLAMLLVLSGSRWPGAAPASSYAAPLMLTPTPTPRLDPAEIGSEIFYLKNSALYAYDLQAERERFIAGGVREFAVTPDGSRLALLIGDESDRDLWLIDRDGSDLQLLHDDDRVMAALDWAPDGLSLVYVTADQPPPALPEWPAWANWCRSGEIRRFDLPTDREHDLARGCDPAFAPDGRRIAYVTPPRRSLNEQMPPMVENQLRVMNRQGRHSWRFAAADPAEFDQGLLVYAPAWAPNGGKVAYHRYLGNQIEVDIVLSEYAGAWSGRGRPIGWGAGWLEPAVFSHDQQYAVLLEHNYADARGFSGYEVWGLQVLKLGQPGSIMLPEGEIDTVARETAALQRAAAAAWAPDANELALLLPPDWQPDVPISEPRYNEAVPGELRRWQPGSPPGKVIVDGLDFASPLRWLPAPPQISAGPAGSNLAHPADWRLRAGAGLLEAAAPGGEQLLALRRIRERDSLQVTELFPEYVAPGALHSRPIRWPDGSVYRGFSGHDPETEQGIAGAIRIYRQDRSWIAVLYRTDAGQWLYERSRAQALLAASGRD